MGMDDDGDSRRIPVPLPRRVGRRAAMLLLSAVGSVDKGVMSASIDRSGWGLRGGRTAQRDIIRFSISSSRRVRHTSRTTAYTDMSTRQRHNKTRSDVVWSALFLFLCILFFHSNQSNRQARGLVVLCVFFVARCCWFVPNPFPCLLFLSSTRALAFRRLLAGWLAGFSRSS